MPTFDKNRSGFRQFQELSIGLEERMDNLNQLAEAS